MKKLVLALLLGLNTSLLVGQITLTHTFNSWEVYPFMKGSETWYAFVNYETVSLDLFRNDFSLYKRVILPDYDMHQGHYGYIFNVSDKLFNDDEVIEILVLYCDNSTGNRSSLVCLVNEDSEFLQEVAAYGYLPIECNFFLSAEGQSMMIVKGARYDNNNVRVAVKDLFTLPGNYLSIEKTEDKSANFYPRPNPATDFIEIPFETSGKSAILRVFDSKGTLIDQKLLSGHNGNLLLQTSQYQKGIYFYNYDGKMNKFVVN